MHRQGRKISPAGGTSLRGIRPWGCPGKKDDKAPKGVWARERNKALQEAQKGEQTPEGLPLPQAPPSRPAVFRA